MQPTDFPYPEYAPRKPNDHYAHIEKRLDAIRQRMRHLTDQVDESIITYYYDFGKEALKLDNFPSMSTYKRPLMEVLAADVGIDLRLLHDCRRLAAEVPDETYRQLAKAPLCWTHIRILLLAGEAPNLKHWAQRIADEQLTTADLYRVLRLGQKPKRAGTGRLPAPPKNFRMGLGRLQSAATAFLRKMEHSIFCQKFDLPSSAMFERPEAITAEVHSTFAEATADLERIAEQASRNAARMREALAWMDEVIQERNASRLDHELPQGPAAEDGQM
jgi:hypothetical protein